MSRKNQASRGREGRPTLCDPFLERIRPETGGLLFYEEQVMPAAEPPVCCLRGQVVLDGTGTVKLLQCSFLKSF